MIVLASYLSIEEVEGERSEVQDHSCIYSGFMTAWGM